MWRRMKVKTKKIGYHCLSWISSRRFLSRTILKSRRHNLWSKLCPLPKKGHVVCWSAWGSTSTFAQFMIHNTLWSLVNHLLKGDKRENRKSQEISSDSFWTKLSSVGHMSLTKPLKLKLKKTKTSSKCPNASPRRSLWLSRNSLQLEWQTSASESWDTRSRQCLWSTLWKTMGRRLLSQAWSS